VPIIRPSTVGDGRDDRVPPHAGLIAPGKIGKPASTCRDRHPVGRLTCGGGCMAKDVILLGEVAARVRR
jgi:hypothetical protein